MVRGTATTAKTNNAIVGVLIVEGSDERTRTDKQRSVSVL